MDLEFQGFSKELESLSVMYGPPDGAMLLAEEGGVWVGCVGLRRLGDGDAEMKRMFVLPAYRGQGIGSKLTEEFITIARRIYEWAGVTRIPPYRHSPDPDAVFMELRLG